MIQIMEFIDGNQKKLLSQSLLDFAKIIIAAFFAGEFFVKFSIAVRIGIIILFVITFCSGIYLGKKEEEL